MLNLECQTW